MKTYTITKSDLDADNYYIGQEDVTEFSGNIHIEANLGIVRFKNGLRASGDIVAHARTGIKAGYGIKAGEGIKAGYGIKAGLGITAGWGIEAGWGITAGYGIKAGDGITAGYGIKAGLGITAGYGIKAGLGITAGWGIEAGWGITAGLGIIAQLGIECKDVLSFNYGLYVGACTWREATEKERQAICGKLEADPSLVKLGEVVETGLPEKAETIEVMGKLYNADELRERLAELKPLD